MEAIVKFETVCLSSLMTLEKNADELMKTHSKDKEFARLQAKSNRPLALPAPEFEHKHGNQKPKRMNNQERDKQQKDED